MTRRTELLALAERVEKVLRKDELASLVRNCDQETCLEWRHALRQHGACARGSLSVDGVPTIASRYAWIVLHGPIPSGMMICHHCDNGCCINPRHLYLGTHKDNMRDMALRRRSFGATQPERCREVGRATGMQNIWARGEGNPKAKLNRAIAERVRMDRRHPAIIAEELGVDRTTIIKIRDHITWK
jgi:hypothetical protein